MRPRQDRFIAGVCAAFAVDNRWDVAVVRIIAACALLFSGGLVAIAYFIAWIVIPDAPYGLPERSSGTVA